MTDTAKQLIARVDKMASDRANFDSVNEDVRNFIRPTGRGFTSTDAKGQTRRHEILDNTAENSHELLAAALVGKMISAFTPWFKIQPVKKELRDTREGSLWSSDSTRRTYKVFTRPESNFLSQGFSALIQVTAYGTVVPYTASRPGQLPLFQTSPVSEFYLAEDANGRVSDVFRRFKLAARQAVKEYGNQAGEKVIKSASDTKSQEDEFEFLHAVFPRDDFVQSSKAAKDMPVESRWINVTEQSDIRMGGFHESPYHPARWINESGEVYGRGAGWKALADTKMLQRSSKSTIRAAERSILPPMQMADDGVLSRKSVRLTDGAINIVRADLLGRGGDGIKPINTGARADIGEEFNESIRGRIDIAFYKQLLALSRDPRLTLGQFLEQLEESLVIISPFVGNLQTEWLAQQVMRVFKILMRQGMLLPLPDILKNEDFEVVFTSSINRAQQLNEAQGVTRTVELMGPLGTIDPTIYDNQDGDASYRHIANLLGQPPDLLRSTDDRDALREERAEAKRQREQISNITDLANAGGQAAPLVRELTQRTGAS